MRHSGQIRSRDFGRHAREVDDLAAVTGHDHRPGCHLGRHQHRAGVDRVHEIPFLDRDIEERGDAKDAGIVDKHVDAAERVDQCRDRRCGGGRVREVDHLDAGRVEPIGNNFHGGIDIEQRNRSSLGAERGGDFGAQATRRASDHTTTAAQTPGWGREFSLIGRHATPTVGPFHRRDEWGL